jgi:cell division protein FtsB
MSTTPVIKSPFFKDTMTMVHIGSEVCVFVILFVYFRNNMNQITSRVDEMNTTIKDQGNEIKSLQDEIKSIRDEMKQMSHKTQHETFTLPKKINKQVTIQQDEDEESLLQYRTPTLTTLEPPPRPQTPPPRPQTPRPQTPPPRPQTPRPQTPPPRPQTPPIEKSKNEIKTEEKVIDLDEALADEISGLD